MQRVATKHNHHSLQATRDMQGIIQRYRNGIIIR